MDFTFTKAGYDAIKKEYEELKNKKHPAAVERLARARAQGDLRENSEYHAAKEDLGRVYGRMKELETLLAKAQVVEPMEKGVVQVGSVITVEVNGGEQTFTMVGPFEANILEKKLSHTSPIGKALMGKKAGESVEVVVPSGKVLYTIKHVE